LWYADGKLIGMAKKLPLAGDFRVNIDRGSKLAPARLDARQKTAGLAISRLLKSAGIRLAAVDLIGPWITDFNFTSPGLIPEMEALLGENLARAIVRSLGRL